MEIPTTTEVLASYPKALITSAVNEHLKITMTKNVKSRTSRCNQRNFGFMTIPIEAKNKAASMLRTGSIFCSVLPAKGVMLIMRPAKKAPSSILKPKCSLIQATVKQNAIATFNKWAPQNNQICYVLTSRQGKAREKNTLKMTRMVEWRTIWYRSMPCLETRKNVARTNVRDMLSATHMKIRVAIAVRNKEATPSMMPWLPPRTGSKAISNPIVQSCKIRVPTVICPETEWNIFRAIKHLTTTAVDDMERKAPMNMPSVDGAPIKSATTQHKNIMSKISRVPPASDTDWTRRSFEKENSRPSVNSRNITPNWARVSTWQYFLIVEEVKKICSHKHGMYLHKLDH